MKLLLVCVLLLFVGIYQLFPQNIDSLQKELSKAKNDTNKVNILIALFKQVGVLDEVKKRSYADSALELSAKLNYRKGMIMSRIGLAVCLNNSGNFEVALKYANEALKMAVETPKDKRTLADIYNIIGISYFYKNDFTIALSNYLKSLELYRAVGKKGRVANVEYNIANIYFQNKDYLKAIKHVKEVIEIYKQLQENVMLASATSQLANIYTAEKEYKLALYYYNQSLLFTEKFEDKSYSVVNLVGIGDVLFKTEKNSEALIYCKKALEISKGINDQLTTAIILGNTGSIYFKLGAIPESIRYLNQAVDMSERIGAKKITKDSYQMLYKCFEVQNNFKDALKYSKLYITLNDSIYNEDNAAQINELSARYESEKKEKEIALLNADLLVKQKDKEVLNAKVKEKNSLIAVIISGTVFLIVVVMLFFNRRQLKQKNKYQAEINEQQKKNAVVVMQAQENERNRIAKDLHDGVGTFLSTLKINLQVLGNSVSPEKMSSYHNIMELADRTSAELRNITKNISSETLIESGLTEALEELVQSVNRLGAVRLEFITHGITKRLDGIIEVTLYRVAQELVVNCVKHAQASEATLQLIAHEENVLLMLEDNGSGLPPENSRQENETGGMGLKNVYDRVNFIKGTLKIETGRGRGTTFIIEAPKYLL